MKDAKAKNGRRRHAVFLSACSATGLSAKLRSDPCLLSRVAETIVARSEITASLGLDVEDFAIPKGPERRGKVAEHAPYWTSGARAGRWAASTISSDKIRAAGVTLIAHVEGIIGQHGAEPLA